MKRKTPVKPLVMKFSHEYSKLLNEKGELIKMAKLLGVVPIPDISNLSLTFIDYDTDGGLYKLPTSGKFLMLIFLKPKVKKSANLFTTLRRYEPEKFRYYSKNVGQVFSLEFIKPE